MKIIEQSHKILSYTGIDQIELAGRTCYQSVSKGEPEKFVRMLRDKGHHAMIEFGDITVRFITNRSVTHELVRHRMCSFAQESTRYVKYDGDMEFIRPVWCSGKVIGNYSNKQDFPVGLAASECYFLRYLLESELIYKYLRMEGCKAQQAREALVNSLKAEIVVKANIREWRHIFNLRTSKAAHPQIRALMLPLLKKLKTKIPVVFDDIFEGQTT